MTMMLVIIIMVYNGYRPYGFNGLEKLSKLVTASTMRDNKLHTSLKSECLTICHGSATKPKQRNRQSQPFGSYRAICTQVIGLLPLMLLDVRRDRKVSLGRAYSGLYRSRGLRRVRALQWVQDSLSICA